VGYKFNVPRYLGVFGVRKVGNAVGLAFGYQLSLFVIFAEVHAEEGNPFYALKALRSFGRHFHNKPVFCRQSVADPRHADVGNCVLQILHHLPRTIINAARKKE
jgi:hypothetical protein